MFRGIPFARPPLGPLRFRAPEPPEPWAGVRDATRAGPVAIQAGVPLMRFLNAGGAGQSEDCLYLNVWTPGLDDVKRPVLVWIHGGAFLIGAGSTPIYRGEALARRGDLVVVTLNYRLGALGFLHLNGLEGDGLEGASNAGIRDQIAALEWVRENIGRFGGDPDNVTVCGQSAGAMSVAALLGAPRARRFFQRAICQSGAAENVMTQREADRVAEALLAALGGPARTRDALARIPVEQILKAQGVVNRKLARLDNLMVFVPCVDDDLIPEQPIEAVRRGEARHLSLMVGTTLDEWKLFTALDSGFGSLRGNLLVERMRDLLPKVTSRAPEPALAAWQYREAVRARGGRTSALEVWSAFQSARVFHYPASLLAEAQARARGHVYSYLFTWRPPALRRTLGAFHAIDVPFVFGLDNHPLTRPLAGLADTANRLSHRIQDAWAAFAYAGRPGHENLPDWETYGVDSRATMVFGRQSYLADAPLESERNLWERWT